MGNDNNWGRFQHRYLDGAECELPPGKVVCVGRNYAAHAKELDNPVPTEPVLFIKPSTTLQALDGDIVVPESDCHYETELAVLIGARLSRVSVEEVSSSIWAYTLALDLTRRGKQSELKSKSLPWELAKSFDGACPLGPWVNAQDFGEEIEFEMYQNGSLKQHGFSKDMLNPVLPLIAHMSQTFTLMPGDIILTGTPEGVGEIKKGDELKFVLDKRFSFHSKTH